MIGESILFKPDERDWWCDTEWDVDLVRDSSLIFVFLVSEMMMMPMVTMMMMSMVSMMMMPMVM